MTIAGMHYDFKQKLNKLDSQKYRNLKVPEIDWKLNEAQEVFVKVIAQPRLGSQLGFEINQRTTDDIRTIVVNQKFDNGIVPTVFDNSSFKVSLPDNYWFFINCKIFATKATCSNVLLKRSKEVQHDDEHEVSPFDRSSFEWRVANYRFFEEGLRVFTDGTFTITKVAFEYLKRPTLMHNAAAYINGTYIDIATGNTLTGTQNCVLPETVHRDIVDLAVLITAGDLSLSDYQLKENKLKITS